MKHFFSIFLLSILAIGSAHAQHKLTVLKYEEFEKIIITPSPDTIVIYNFWATWCGPCVSEIPDFEKFGKQYAGKKVKLVFVSLDFISKKEAVEKFVSRKKLKSEVWLLDAPDYNKWIDKVNPQWGGMIPATMLVLGPKAERRFHEGPLTYAELEKFIIPLLK